VLKIYNWDLYFYLFLGMEEDAAADSPPHALASAGPISVAVGALCWWDMETWVTHYIYRSDPAVCHILRLSFQVVFLGQSCMETFYQFHGGNFYFFFYFDNFTRPPLPVGNTPELHFFSISPPAIALDGLIRRTQNFSKRPKYP
jgi:hypothetical protein